MHGDIGCLRTASEPHVDPEIAPEIGNIRPEANQRV